MNYQEIHTNGFISDYIKSFWEFESFDKRYDYEILPDGCFDLIFEIRDGQITNALLTGVWTKQIQIYIPENTKLVAIRFKLISVEYIFNQSIKTLKNTIAEVPKTSLNLNDLDFNCLKKVTPIIIEKFQSKLENLKKVDQRKLELFKTLYEKHGEISVLELAEKITWSSRQINRYFSNRFGLSLKTFCNILKCHYSLKHIADGKLFPENQYYDQAHFIKQVKQITGSTPTILYLNKNDRFLQLTTIQTT